MIHTTSWVKNDNNQYESDWHCLIMRKDFIEILVEFGCLPFDNVRDPLVTIAALTEENK